MPHVKRGLGGYTQLGRGIITEVVVVVGGKVKLLERERANWVAGKVSYSPENNLTDIPKEAESSIIHAPRP